MLNPPICIRVRLVEERVLPMVTRFPFQYGIASMTHLPHLFLRAEVEVNGKMQHGIASEGLPPKWFTKNPATTFEQDLPEMIRAIRKATELAIHVDRPLSFFEFWQLLYSEQQRWADANAVAPLLAHLGTSLVERTVIDAIARAFGTTFHQLVLSDALEIDPAAVHGNLTKIDLRNALPSTPDRTIAFRHTVGLGDPLTENDLTPDTKVDDGLPQSLEAAITAYGLRYFKIKLSGNTGNDLERLRAIASILQSTPEGDYRFTLDGNEQFRSISLLAEFWDTLHSDNQLALFLDHLLFVEQPIHRDHALDDHIIQGLAGWRAAPLLIIDESDATIESLPRALSLGYSGTSHKNCKGVTKGLLNAALLHRHQQRGDGAFILSGEDLANVGPIALLQDLTVMATLGISHVERNGHHYFRGLSMLPGDIQDNVLVNHGDLYCRHTDGYPAIQIVAGQTNIGSVVDAPFGCSFMPDLSAFESLDDWLRNSLP